jgi:hypothetical protein
MVNKYKEILDLIEWSFSSAHLYEQCPYALYNKKICGEAGIDNAFAEIGKFAHKINEKIFKNEINLDEALDEWINDFENHVFSYISESSKEKKYLAFCDYLSSFDEKYTEKYDVLGVEEEFHWKVGKYKCIGYPDLTLKEKETGDIILTDHKSAPPFFGKKGGLLKAQAENFDTYSKQMYMYCKPIYEKYKTFPKKIVWNHMFDDKRTVIDFNMDDYEKTLVWFKETVKKIYKDTKFEPCKSYMMCNQLCNYRMDCEYKNEEEGG